MLTTLTTYLSYEALFRYIKKKRVDTDTISRILSSINAIALVSCTRLSPLTGVSLCRGYMIYDTFHVLQNISVYQKHYIEYLIHHGVVILLSTIPLTTSFLNLLKELAMLETSVPFMNILWICKKHNIDNMHTKILKYVFFFVYTYYRIYHLLHLLHKSYLDKSSYTIQSLLLFLSLLNVKWYGSIIKIALTPLKI